MRWLLGGGGGMNGNKSLGSVVKSTMVRHFSRKRAENVRKINPKVAFPEAFSISESLYNLIKQHGPVSVSNTWTLAQDANVSGLKSKTHMKIMLKWMRGKNMLKLLCNHIGSSKKFLFSTLPEDPQPLQPKDLVELNLKTEKPALKRKQRQ